MTGTPDMSPVFADFVDGASARLWRVSVAMSGAKGDAALTIRLPDGQALVWPGAEVRRLPDQAGRDGDVYGLIGDSPARLYVRSGDLNARISAVCPTLMRPHVPRGLMPRLLGLAVAAVASVALIVFVLVPVMADQLAVLLPPEGEQALGDATYEQIRNGLDSGNGLGLRECNRSAGVSALNAMARRLETAADLPYPLRLHVLKHDMINAFALPGGHIVLFEGLLKDARSAEEVASVLGHEMGHVAHRDPSRLALRSAGSIGVLGLLLGDFAGGAAILFLTEHLIQAQYSQGAESAADTYSHALLAASGLPTGPMADFFDRLHAKYGSESGMLSHLASHPDSLARSERARAANQVGVDFVPVLSALQWADLKAICNGSF